MASDYRLYSRKAACPPVVVCGKMQFALDFERWEDGELVHKTLEEPNRWEVHSAEEVAVTLGDLRLRIIQQPHQLAGAGINPSKLGVAAALWDGALVLAGYLAAQPHYRYLGTSISPCPALPCPALPCCSA